MPSGLFCRSLPNASLVGSFTSMAKWDRTEMLPMRSRLAPSAEFDTVSILCYLFGPFPGLGRSQQVLKFAIFKDAERFPAPTSLLLGMVMLRARWLVSGKHAYSCHRDFCFRQDQNHRVSAFIQHFVIELWNQACTHCFQRI